MVDNYPGTWRPHRPRGPIAAMFNSPGPKYMLPGSIGKQNHDIRKQCYPAYVFGDRTHHKEHWRSPGPIYKIEKNFTRHGKDGVPEFTLKKRIPNLKVFNNPGPGTYAPEMCGPSSKFMAPAYTLHERTRLSKADHSPGPAAYGLRDLLGSAPKYSLYARRSTKDKFKSPGPAAYGPTKSCVNKFCDPMYSMTSRNYMPTGKSIGPGPGQHRPEEYYRTGKQAPQKSFGVRHSIYCGLPKFNHDDI